MAKGDERGKMVQYEKKNENVLQFIFHNRCLQQARQLYFNDAEEMFGFTEAALCINARTGLGFCVPL